MFTHHSDLKFLIEKRDAKPRLLRWVLLLQEYDFELKDRKGSENVVADHLSRLPELDDDSFPIQDEMVEETLKVALVVGKTLGLQISQTIWHVEKYLSLSPGL